MKKAILIFLFLSSIAFSSLIWQFSANGKVSTEPIVFSDNLLISSSDGTVYLLNPIAGSKTWESKVQGTPLAPILFQGNPAIATRNGKVYALGADGSTAWVADLATAQNVTYVFGIDASSSKIFVTTDKGLYSVGAGSTTLVYSSSNLKTAPTVSGTSVLFGEGNYLVKVSNTGTVEWKNNVKGIWMSKPVVDGSVVYVGGLDKKMHAINLGSGSEKWSTDTGNWVVSSPLVKGGVVYFGSNDGKVYAVDETDGEIIWSKKTGLAIQTKPESGTLGGQEVVFLGGTDNRIYAIDVQTGSIVWKGSAKGWVSDPLFYQNYVFFGSQDKSVYAYSTERACSILTPSEGDVIGFKEVKVTGNAVSESGSPSVDVQVNTLGWESANVSGENWVYYFDPSKKLTSGVNTISCRVSDAAGTETGTYTTVGIVHDSTLSKGKLIVTTKGAKVEGQPFEIFVNDGEDGSAVERFGLTLNGQNYNGTGSVNVTVPSGGRYSLTAKKIGFNDAVLSIDIASTGINPIFIGVAVVLILIIAWQVYVRFVKK